MWRLTRCDAIAGDWIMGQRPPHMKPPEDLPPNPPVPAPGPDTQPEPGSDRHPTRYGDWEKKGIAIDF